MRCANLGATWANLRRWLELRHVLVLPPLHANLPLARLDADSDGTGDDDDVERVVDRLRILITHFDVRAVYVDSLYVDEVHVEQADDIPTPAGVGHEIAVVTIRVLAAGAVHELKLFACWYVDFLDSAIISETAQLR